MPVLTSVLSRYAKRVLTRGSASGSFRRANRRSRRRAHGFHRVAVEVLEELTLLSPTVVFSSGSCVGIGKDKDRATAVATDSSGNIYVTGHFSGTVNFNPNGNTSLTATGTTSVFVAKYDSNDDLIWVDQMGGNATTSSGITDSGTGIALDASGNVYVIGNFKDSSATFGSTILNNAGGGAAFVEKLNAAGTVLWAKIYGTSGEDPVGVGVDSSGNVYTLGVNWSASTDADWTYDIFKFRSSGAAVWSESIYTHEPGLVNGFAVDGSGDVFVDGIFQGTVNFSPTGRPHDITSPEVNDPSGFILKLNTSGKLQWVSAFIGQTVDSSNGDVELQSLVLDNSGNVIVGGNYVGTVDFNSGTTTLPTAGGGLLAKLNSSGGLVWAEGLVGSTSVSALAVDGSNNIYAIGVFSTTVAFNPSNSSQIWTAAGPLDSFVLEVNASGSFDQVDTFGGPGSCYATAVSVETNGTVVVVGGYEGTVNFDPNGNNGDGDMTSSSTTSYDLFILQLSEL